LMECMMHLFYVVSMSKAKAWNTLSAFELSQFSYWNLKFIWLKLMIIWRFFRMWAMLDGVDVEENMVRCMSNNYSAVDFWRTWHKSYNRWLVRYLYVPLGGQTSKIRNTLIVFTFVAIWHDIELRLLIWGWLITLFVLPEITLSAASKKYLQHKPYYRHLCGLGASLNILMMMIANLVGFCDGAMDAMRQLFQVKSTL
jgi:protein-cysteine N-palmitoyltransferase HHAT